MPNADDTTHRTQSIHIRQERPGDPHDAAAVNMVQRAAFPTPVEAKLLDSLQQVGAYDPVWSLVAETQDGIVGHCLLTAATLVHADGTTDSHRIVALGPIGVLPAWQRRGVGAALMRAAVQQADAHGFAAIVLLGHASYYPRFGFRPARAQGLHPPADWSDASWQACRLSSWQAADVGTVHYAAPFMQLDDAPH